MSARLFYVVFLFPFFLSCASLSYFESPNNLRNIHGKLHLKNGKSYEGKLIIETENMFGRPVKLIDEEDHRPMQFNLKDVKAFSVKNELYELKEIHEGLNLGKQLYFMKRLTPGQSRIHLYEFLKKETVNKTSVRHQPELYLQLPGEDENYVHAATGSKFVPHFEEKVSRMVQDCPTLAKKIADRNYGYFYAQVNLLKERRAEVLLRIIEEYNECGENAKR